MTNLEKYKDDILLNINLLKELQSGSGSSVLGGALVMVYQKETKSMTKAENILEWFLKEVK